MKVDQHRQFFETIYKEHADKIYRHCLFRIFSPEKAEELMQEIFMKFWKYLEEGNEIQNAKGLLYRLADHTIIDEKRKHKSESLEALVEEQEFDLPSAEHIKMENKSLCNEAIRELKTLREDEQKIFMLRYMDDMDPKDIAELTGSTANTVSVQLSRISAKLRTKLT